LGKLENIVNGCRKRWSDTLYAEVFQWGLPTGIVHECQHAKIMYEVDALCPKRDKGKARGQLVIAAITGPFCPYSKQSMWEWFLKPP